LEIEFKLIFTRPFKAQSVCESLDTFRLYSSRSLSLITSGDMPLESSTYGPQFGLINDHLVALVGI